MSELKPCPFCGSSDVYDDKGADDFPTTSCNDCGATVSSSQWNTRTPQWLPIDDAPAEGVWAFVYADGAMNCAFVQQGKLPDDWTRPNCPNINADEVTHFMPLPQPPK